MLHVFPETVQYTYTNMQEQQIVRSKVAENVCVYKDSTLN